MSIVCIGYVSYGVFPWIPLHSVIADIGNNGNFVPQLVRYNEGCMLNKQSQTDEYRQSSNFEDWAWNPYRKHGMLRNVTRGLSRWSVMDMLMNPRVP
jgi:hypothetical protein